MESVALIGDIHGCADELETLLGRVGDRTVISLGDVIDRGPAPDRVVDILRDRNALVLLGNHEEKHLRYQRRIASPIPGKPLPQLNVDAARTHAQLGESRLSWLRVRCTPFLRLNAFHVIAVHAGLLAGRAPERHHPASICRVQMTRPGGERKSPWTNWRESEAGTPELFGDETESALADGYRFWTEFRYRTDATVVFGHSVVPVPLSTYDRGGQREHVFVRGGKVDRRGLVALGLDTGAPFGGSLTALLLPEWELVSVAAQRQYAARRNVE